VKRTIYIWFGFGLFLTVVLSAMGWLSVTMVRLDKAETAARLQVALEENVRLALWRMDSFLAPILSQESAYPYFYFKPFYPAQRAYYNMFSETIPSDVLIPSPLKDKKSPFILLHFQFEPDGKISSPEVSGAAQMEDVKGKGETANQEQEARRLLVELSALIKRGDFPSAGTLEKPARLAASTQSSRVPQEPQPQPGARSQAQNQFPSQQQIVQQSAINVREWEKRAEYTQQAIEFNISNFGANLALPESGATGGVMQPVWQNQNLFLFRRMDVKGQDYIQGSWIAWPVLKKRLLEGVKDILPAADLFPVTGDVGGTERMLASLPVKLVPGGIPPSGGNTISPLRLILAISWVCAILAASAVGALLFGAVSLSERRGAFVSAVTHELRTPLTTLRMYTEMLSEGMIGDETKRMQYLNTMREEAERLGHLVENVLMYARLERRRTSYHSEILSPLEIVARSRERLIRRAVQAGMSLVIEEDETGDSSAKIKVDPLIVEQILFNLVDNACKYAANAEDKRILFRISRLGENAVFQIRDHGQGITGKETKRLFKPFNKSARQAANSAPGVGLGLALCRRLARMMGGTLKFHPEIKDGADFSLIIPLHPY